MSFRPSQQGEQPRIKELVVLEEVLPKRTFLLEAALSEDTGRRRLGGRRNGSRLALAGKMRLNHEAAP
jgi:hypothetical protein